MPLLQTFAHTDVCKLNHVFGSLLPICLKCRFVHLMTNQSRDNCLSKLPSVEPNRNRSHQLQSVPLHKAFVTVGEQKLCIILIGDMSELRSRQSGRRRERKGSERTVYVSKHLEKRRYIQGRKKIDEATAKHQGNEMVIPPLLSQSNSQICQKGEMEGI